MIFKRRVLGLVLAVMVSSPIVSWGQPLRWDPASPQIPTPPHQSEQEKQEHLGDEQREKMKKELQKKANQERLQEIKRDTDKLLELATELKAYVDKTNENMLSLDVINKAEQIEKLAHSVKDKMKAN